MNSPLPFAFPEATPGHVLPVQPSKGNSVHPVGASAVWLQPGTRAPQTVSQLS